jgi:hypothetical protein
MARKLILVAVVAGAAALGSAVYATAGGSGAEAGSEGPAAPRLSLTFVGGPQEFEGVVTRDTSQSIPEGVTRFVQVDGGGAMQINRFVPAGDFDTFVVTFSSQSQLLGAGPGDTIEIQALANGVAMAPIGSVAFDSDRNAESHAATFSRRLAGGSSGTTYTIRITWRLFDNGSNNALTGVFDDTTLHVEESA